MTKAELIRVPALDDNYIWMLHDPSSNALAVIDPAMRQRSSMPLRPAA